MTRRLILDTSADSEMEENMVEWLRVILPEFAYDKSFLPKLKIHLKFQTLIFKVLGNELSYGNFIPKRFHLIGIIPAWDFVRRLETYSEKSSHQR